MNRPPTTLRGLGFDETYPEGAGDSPPGAHVARVVEEQKRYYFVDAGSGSVLAEVAGKLRHEAKSRADFPAVGDFVWIEARSGGGGRIVGILPRRTKLSRKASGLENEEQVLCTNVDVGFIVVAQDDNLNARRLERYVALVESGGARPVFILSKTDLNEGLEAARASILALAPGVEIVPTSVLTKQGVTEISAILRPGRTAVFLGPSGAGKSSLINLLHGESVQAVGDVRQVDRKGRHTTTARTLLRLSTGALVIDTPGLRELEVWAVAEPTAPEASFADVVALAADCRFRDCAHDSEPECAVRAAQRAGTLEAGRLEAFLKLTSEAVAQLVQREARARAEESRRSRVTNNSFQSRVRDKYRG